MRPGDPLGDYAQRAITLTLILKPVVANEPRLGMSWMTFLRLDVSIPHWTTIGALRGDTSNTTRSDCLSG